MFSNDERIATYTFRGLKGRYAYMPAKDPASKRVFLMIYGQHATIERCMAIVEAMTTFGAVYLVDTPGFGGMEPSYKLGEYPDLNFYDDHIQNIFDTLLPKEKKVTVFAISYGFEIITHFLSTKPEYHQRIEDVIDFVGLVSKHELHISAFLRFTLKYLACGPGKTWLGSKVYQYLIFRDWTLRIFYYFYSKRNVRFAGVPRSELWHHAAEQSWLWRINDIRTHGATAWDFLFVTDLTNLRIALPVIHIGVPSDHFLDNERVVSDITQIYSNITNYTLDLPSHAPIAFDTPDKLLDVVPEALQSYLLTSKP